MQLNADLHIHSLFSMATSGTMEPSAILDACTVKGIGAIASGDALHPRWREMWRGHLENEQGVIVIPSTEVQGVGRVHHLILMEDFEACEVLAAELSPFSRNLATAGRPHVALSGEEIAGHVHDAGGLIGPAHAFTPWTGMYGSFDRVHDCYGTERIDFLELGLSADSSYGEGITDLYQVPFLSNSDAHSPSPHKLGREFNRVKVASKTVRSVLESVTRGMIEMNAGFFPEEGKYNRTACTRCYQHYTLDEAMAQGWKCPVDGGRIKKGVQDRAHELSDGDPHPRPPYFHIIPLGEIIQQCLKTSSPQTRRCRLLYQTLVETIGNEIAILCDVPVNEIACVDVKVANAVEAFRNGTITLIPGGGGQYGSFALPE